MKIRHTQVHDPKTGETWEELTHDVTLEKHIELKLKHVGSFVSGAMKDLDLTEFDLQKYDSAPSLLDKDKKARCDEFRAVQQKHADIKRLIKSRATHEELDEIAWSSFKKKFLWFFKVDY